MYANVIQVKSSWQECGHSRGDASDLEELAGARPARGARKPHQKGGVRGRGAGRGQDHGSGGAREQQTVTAADVVQNLIMYLIVYHSVIFILLPNIADFVNDGQGKPVK